jgi:hypothetical protein
MKHELRRSLEATLSGAPSVSANVVRWRVSFHFVMALLMLAAVIYGFSQTIDDNLLHPSIPRPRLLYVHAALFSAWIALYILQTGLIASGNTVLHRRLGAAWVAVGAALPIVAIAVGIVMRRFRVIHGESSDITFIGIILWDAVAFGTLFLLAVLCRRRPEYHRRLMFLATCSLMTGPVSRFPLVTHYFPSTNFFGYDLIGGYTGVVALVLIAMTRDLIVQHRVHVVYRVALPLMLIGQALACAMSDYPSALWTATARKLIGAG